MTEIVLQLSNIAGVAEKNVVLVFDDADIVDIHSPRDVHAVSCAEAGCQPGCMAKHHRMGQAHLVLDFAPGKAAMWRDIAAAESA